MLYIIKVSHRLSIRVIGQSQTINPNFDHAVWYDAMYCSLCLNSTSISSPHWLLPPSIKSAAAQTMVWCFSSSFIYKFLSAVSRLSKVFYLLNFTINLEPTFPLLDGCVRVCVCGYLIISVSCFFCSHEKSYVIYIHWTSCQFSDLRFCTTRCA